MTSRSGARARVPDLEADLVVALPRAAVGDGSGAVLAGLGHQVPDDDRSGQGRHQGVLALVLGVGHEGGHAELLGHLGPGVDHLGLDGPGGQGPAPDGLPVLPARLRGLADVDGHSDHLDALVLDQPPDGHRGVQSTAVGQYHSLRHHHPLVVEPSVVGTVVPGSVVVRYCALPAAALAAAFGAAAGLGHRLQAGHRGQAVGHGRAARCLRGHDQDGVVPGHRPDHPREAAPVEGRAHHMGRARRRAQHDQVAGVVGLDHPLAQHPAQVVLGRHLMGGQLGQGVGRLPAGEPDLERPELLEVAGHGGLGGVDALGGQELDQVGLAAHRLGLQQPGDPVLALVLGHRGDTCGASDPNPVPAPRPAAPRMACIRLRGLGPHHAPGPVHHAGADLLAPVGGKAVEHHGIGRRPATAGPRPRCTRRRRPAGRSARPPGPSRSTRRCRWRPPRQPPRPGRW